MKSTIYDVAKAAGVSTSTVSRVFNRRGLISEEVEQRVLKIAREINYRPQQSALKNSFILLVDSEEQLDSPYISHFITSTAKIITQKGWPLEIVPMDRIDFSLNNMSNKIISLVQHPKNHKKLININYPKLVTVNSLYPQFPSVASNNRQGMEMVVKYFADRGHRKIALLQPDFVYEEKNARADFFREALEKYNCEISPRLMIRDKSADGITMESLVKILNRKPTALMCSGDALGVRISYYLNLLKIPVPDELSVIAFENHHVSDFLYPPQTTIGHDFDQMTTEIYDYFVKDNFNSDDQICVDFKFFERDSVGSV
jgi:LacI family transcriptional regulator